MDVSSPEHSNHVISTNGKYAERIWFPEVPIIESVQSELLGICQSHMRERCGFISSEWEVHEVPNVHKESYRNFYMDDGCAKETLEFIYENREEHVIAIWHTHPNNVTWPSPRDIRGWPDQRLGWRYLIVTNLEITEWKLTNEQPI
jgi:proteasome lid subunit RPN8/RPN11